MTIFGHSEFFSDNFSVHITLIECNGLEINKKFFEKYCQKETFLSKKNSMKKKTNLDKNFFFQNLPKFGNFPKFLGSDIFQRSCEKQWFLHLEHI